MASQALYLTYRPQTFDQVVGQEPITRTLRNALRQERLRHAYLFTGPRGTGKTTTARLLAKAANCLAPQEERPCNACSICVAINEGRLLDLIEIDAASNRGIDEIRDIREKVGFRPNEGRFKVYVLDEAHMLTEPAFNALLKTLEEPPPHVIFVLVTTDPQKIPTTITSRCQRFDFRRIPMGDMVARLAYIAEQEGLSVQTEALELIAHQGTGAMRDAISLLDQLASYGDEIVLEQVQMVLGTVAGEAAGKLAACLADGDIAAGLDLISRTVADGADPRQFGREVVEYLRGLLLIGEGAGTRLLRTTAEQAAEMEALAARIPLQRLVRAIRLFNEASTDLRRGFQTIPQLPLELALVESLAGVEPSSTQAGPADRSGEANSSGPAAAGSQPDLPQARSQRVAEQSAPLLSGSEADVSPPASPPSAAAAGTVTLEQLTEAWDEVLRAVRRLNPTAEGALRSGCQPVEVNGNEVVVTFPYPFLREKLGDPQRKMEIQEALGEVLGIKCRLKLVLASEHQPSRPANPQSADSQATAPGAQAAASGPQATTGPQAAGSQAMAAGPQPAANQSEMDDQDLDKLYRWAKGVGGQVIEE